MNTCQCRSISFRNPRWLRYFTPQTGTAGSYPTRHKKLRNPTCLLYTHCPVYVDTEMDRTHTRGHTAESQFKLNRTSMINEE